MPKSAAKRARAPRPSPRHRDAAEISPERAAADIAGRLEQIQAAVLELQTAKPVTKETLMMEFSF